MIGPENTINDILRNVAEKIRDSGDATDDTNQKHVIERVRQRWNAEKMALIKDLANVHVLTLTKADKRIFRKNMEEKLKWWKETEHRLSEEANTQGIEISVINKELGRVTAELQKTDCRFSGRDAVAYRVLINAQKTLVSLWSSYLASLEEVHNKDLCESIGILYGSLNGLQTILKSHKDGTDVLEAEYATLCKAIAEGPLEMQDLNDRCAKLKRTLIERIYTPLRAELVNGGVDPNFAAISINAATAAADPFSVRECIAVEEVLMKLPGVYSHGASSQTQALVEAKSRIAELRQQWHALQKEETQALGNEHQQPTDVAAAIRAIRSQTTKVMEELHKTEEQVKLLISNPASPPPQENDKDTRNILLKRARDLLETCRKVRRTVQSAKTFGSTFQRIAATQHERSLKMLVETAKDECHSVEADAHRRMTTHAKNTVNAMNNAKQLLAEADIVDEARASQRIEARLSSEMVLHGRIERAVQLRHSLTKANAKLVEINSFVRIARRVIALCEIMMQENI